MGFGFNILTAMLTPLIVVLAISDDVHLIHHYDHERRHCGGEEAFKATVSYLFAPLLAASGTTALGLLSLATSDVVAIQPFRHRGGGWRDGRLRVDADSRSDLADLSRS